MRAYFLKNKNASTTWLLSYSVVILSVLILVAVLVCVYSSAIKKERRDFNEFVFESVTTSVNETLLEVNDLRNSITQNNNLAEFLEYSGDVYNLEATYKLIDDFKNSRKFMANTDSLFVYVKDSDVVISEKGVMDSAEYFNHYFDSKKLKFSEWKDQLLNQNNNRYTTMPCISSDNKNFDAAAFLFSIPFREERAVGVILCDKKNFVKNIEKIEWKSLCDIFIYNGDGNLVIYDKNSKNAEIPFTTKDIKKYENRKNLVYRKAISVDAYYWQVVTIVPNKALSRDIYIRQTVIIAAILFSLIPLYLLVMYLIKRNYRPIASIMSLLGIDDTIDEFGDLHKKINETLTTNKSLLKNVQQKDKELKSVAISKIIKGNLDHKALMEYNIFFKNENYAIVAFDCEDVTKLFAEEENMPVFEKNFYLRYIIENITTEIFAEESIGLYATEIDDDIVCLINLTDGDSLTLINSLTQKSVGNIKKYFNINLYYAISDIYASILDLPTAYEQTMEILKYKQLMKDNESVFYDQIKQKQGKNYIFDFEREKNLVRCIEQGDSDKARIIIQMVFEDIQESKGYSIDYIRYVIYDMASAVTKCANEIVGYEFDFTMETELCKCINEGKTLEEFQAAVEEYVQIVCGFVSTTAKKRKPKRCSYDDIIEYVNENLTDKTLCVAKIGDHFNLTPKHISRVFREKSDVSLVDYISKTRVKYAHKLMSEGEYTVQQVSDMVGFGHERTFYRAQKKFKF